MNEYDILFDLFKLMFIIDTGKEFIDQIDINRINNILFNNLKLDKKANLLQAEVDYYVCTHK